MTKREAAIISAYTRYLIGNIKDLREYATEKLNRHIRVDEFMQKRFADELKEASRDDFNGLLVEE